MNTNLVVRVYRMCPTAFGLLICIAIIWAALVISPQSFLIYRQDIVGDRMFYMKCGYFGGIATNTKEYGFANKQEQERIGLTCPFTHLISNSPSRN